VRRVLDRIGEMLGLYGVLQELLGVLQIVHELDRQLGRFGCAVRAHEQTATKLRVGWGHADGRCHRGAH
jgi:hypothetical protein